MKEFMDWDEADMEAWCTAVRKFARAVVDSTA
jgi:hypothetical protein